MYLGIFLQGIKSFIITPLERLCSIALYVFSLLKNSCYFPDRPGCMIRDGNKTPSGKHGESQIPHVMQSPFFIKTRYAVRSSGYFVFLINNAILLLTCQPINGQTQPTWTGSARFKAIYEQKPAHNYRWEIEPAFLCRWLNSSSYVRSCNPSPVRSFWFWAHIPYYCLVQWTSAFFIMYSISNIFLQIYLQ